MCFYDSACFIESVNHILRERPFLAVSAVLLQLRGTAGTQDDTVGEGENGVVLAPSQRNLSESQIVFFLVKYCLVHLL